MNGRFGIIIIGLIGLAVYYFSNQEYNPWSGTTDFNTISIDQASELGAQSYVQMLQQEGGNVLCPQGPRSCSGAELEVYRKVNEIGERLRVAAIEMEDDYVASGASFTPVAREFNWTFNVINSQQPNAFCLPGGYVAVYTQIMDVAGDFDGRFEVDDDLTELDMLAVIMGHEIGHALAHHGAKRMSNQRLVQMGSMAVGVGLGDMSGQQRMAVQQAMGMAAQGGLMAFSRDHETEADRIGLQLLVRACYDPRKAPLLWERMGQMSGGSKQPEWMSTHPSSEKRAENFRRMMPAAIAEYERRCGSLPR